MQKSSEEDSYANIPGEDAFTLYYGKFRTNAPRIKSLVEEIEKRANRNDEFVNILLLH